MAELQIVRLPTAEERERAAVDNGEVVALLNQISARAADGSCGQMVACGVAVAYSDGAVGTAWAGDGVLDLLKALNLLRLRAERSVE